ncbi:MAG: hypothetical protein Q8R72_09600 [Hylemonella sp.]|nr:hypothetical protein [Hylemonella sp.]
MPSPLSFRQPAAAPRLLLLGALVFVVLLGLLGAWTQAQAASLTEGTSELSHFMPAEGGGDMGTGVQADKAPTGLSCLKPAAFKSTAADFRPSEVSDKDVHSRVVSWMSLPQAVPAQAPQPGLAQTVREPLLRPPARLG